MDPVVFTADVARDVRVIANKSFNDVIDAIASAMAIALEDEDERPRASATVGGDDDGRERGRRAGDARTWTTDERRGVRALAWVFIECLRASLTREAFEKRLVGFGFAPDASAAAGETYESARFKSAFTRAMSNANATNRGSMKYDGLNWRLDVRVASRALHMEAEPKYLLRLRRRRVDGRGGVDGTTTTFAETDYQTLNAMREECEKALEACSGARANRLARYVRRPKT